MRDSMRLADEGVYAGLRERVIAMWEAATDRPWNRRVDYVQRFLPPHDQVSTLFLALEPIETVTLVEEKSRSSAEWTTIDPTSYDVAGNRELAKYSGFWLAQVRVKYTGGYTEAPSGPTQLKTPDDVAGALIVQAGFLVQRMSNEKLIVASTSFEAGSTQYLDASQHPHFKEMVKRYRRVN